MKGAVRSDLFPEWRTRQISLRAIDISLDDADLRLLRDACQFHTLIREEDLLQRDVALSRIESTLKHLESVGQVSGIISLQLQSWILARRCLERAIFQEFIDTVLGTDFLNRLRSLLEPTVRILASKNTCKVHVLTLEERTRLLQYLHGLDEFHHLVSEITSTPSGFPLVLPIRDIPDILHRISDDPIFSFQFKRALQDSL